MRASRYPVNRRQPAIVRRARALTPAASFCRPDRTACRKPARATYRSRPRRSRSSSSWTLYHATASQRVPSSVRRSRSSGKEALRCRKRRTALARASRAASRPDSPSRSVSSWLKAITWRTRSMSCTAARCTASASRKTASSPGRAISSSACSNTRCGRSSRHGARQPGIACQRVTVSICPGTRRRVAASLSCLHVVILSSALNKPVWRTTGGLAGCSSQAIKACISSSNCRRSSATRSTAASVRR